MWSVAQQRPTTFFIRKRLSNLVIYNNLFINNPQISFLLWLLSSFAKEESNITRPFKQHRAKSYRIERVPLNKDNNIYLIKLGQEYYVATSNNGSFEIIKELSKDEVTKLEENKEIPQYNSFKDFICDIKSKFRKNEEKK